MKFEIDLKYLIAGVIIGLILVIAFSIYTHKYTTVYWEEEGIIFGGTSNEKIENDIANANNQFALDFYSRYKSEEGNLFFSPLGISTAFAMAFEGAKGQTADEMQSVFYFLENSSLRRSNYKELFDKINREYKGYNIHLANAIWVQQDYPILLEYSSLIEQYYTGKVTNLDLMQDPKGSSKEINNWVSMQTNSKIRRVVSPDSITDITRAIITNTVYFKADWVEQFNRDSTEKQNFTIAPGNVVKARMMQQWATKLNYAENEQLQILEMPYVGGEVSMLILLPRKNLAALEDSLTAESLSEWKNSLEERWVDVFMPKFNFISGYSLKKDLEDMGMPTAFSDLADFSGITKDPNFMITDAIHQTFIKVNEEGTEAAATTVLAGASPAPPMPRERVVFRADHPFIFLIQDIETGNILFIGRIVDPTE